MSSPFQKKFCGKSPFKQEDPKEESLLTGTVFETIPTIKEIKNRFNLGIDQAKDKVDSLKKIDPVVKVVTAPRKKRKSLEHIGEEFFNFPQEKARRRTDGYLDIIPDEDGLMQAQNSFEYGDTSRHYFAGDETSRSIQDKFKSLPYPTRVAMGIAGSNIGGWLHEYKNLKDGNPFLESLEDGTNNFWGSLASLFSRDTSTKILDKTKKYLPDGKVKK
jgi:hypothetical protein